MKKRLITLLMALMMLPLPATAVGAEGITVEINSVPVVFDVPPQAINNRTMVPIRKIFEALGAVVTWDGTTQTATGKKDDTVVNISLNSTTLIKNGAPVLMDTAPVAIDGRILVPARAVAESFDCKVDWDGETSTVIITTDDAGEKKPLTAEEIAYKTSNAVFYIEVYNKSGEAIASGSGFFISDDGTAVTNYHVIESTSSAYATTTDNRSFKIDNIVKYDKDLDVAVIKVSKTDTDGKPCEAFPFIEMGNSNNIKAGQTVYAIGSPRGLQNTISNGIISNVKQTVGEQTYIQTTAAISHGSSGGALVNEYGEVIGITSAGLDDAQNIGFAIPINEVNSLNKATDAISYDDFSKLTQSVSLEISDTEITVEKGRFETVYVYAGGAEDEDWSVYWKSEDESVASCEWGDWLDEYPDICPLYIYGDKVGETTVTITADMNFEPQYCKVTVTEAAEAEFYEGTTTPTYTYYSGIEEIGYEDGMYIYPLDESIVAYMKWLIDLGYEIVDATEEDYGTSYFMADHYVNFVSVICTVYDEVWIMATR